MDVAKYLSTCSFWSPEHLTHPLTWAGHIPSAFWIMEATSPRIMVELGTHSGNPYFSFCQAVKLTEPENPVLRRSIAGRAMNMPAFTGGRLPGRRREEPPRVRPFSRLIRSQFDEAHDRFDDASIDLLHIDGLHTYEAVKHDFEKWLPNARSSS